MCVGANFTLDVMLYGLCIIQVRYGWYCNGSPKISFFSYFLKIFWWPDLLQYNTKNNNKQVLEAVQTLDTSFSTSVTERISWVDVSYNSKTSCVLHVINNYAVIIFASYIAWLITVQYKKQQ
jgi:hypothetical protein